MADGLQAIRQIRSEQRIQRKGIGGRGGGDGAARSAVEIDDEDVVLDHQQLAEMLGSYRETVTKAVGEFREAGLIRIAGDMIYLLEVPRLRALVDA